MATQAIAGRGVVWNFNTGSASTTKSATQVVDFQLEVERPTIDASSFDSSGWQESIAGIASWRGTYSGWYTAAGSGAQVYVKGLLTNLIASSPTFTSLKFATSTSATAQIFSGTAQVTRITLRQSFGGACRYTVAFEGYNALTYTTA